MEGIRLTQSRSFWLLQRTPDTFPSYINDIAQSVMEYVAEVSRERVRYRRSGYGASQPVEAPNGSTDAFYIKIDKHYGSTTQYKRAAAVGTGALAALSSGTDEMAARILSENVGRGLSRMGESHTKGLGYMADATSAAALMDSYKEARIAVLHQAEVEKGVVNSASILWTEGDSGKQKTRGSGSAVSLSNWTARANDAPDCRFSQRCASCGASQYPV